MIAGQDGNIAQVFRVLIPVKILVQEAVYIAAGVFFEIAVVLRVPVPVNAAAVIVVVSHQRGIAAAELIENEVHVVTAAQG